MPIRFRCKRCHQLLGITSRKVGKQVQCPKCSISLRVPTEEAANAALAMDTTAALSTEDASDFIVYDDEPAALETPRARHAAGGTATKDPPPPATPPARSAAGQATPTPPVVAAAPEGRPLPRGMILLRRRSFYMQGFLFFILAAAAFGAGYYIGRSDASYEKKLAAEAAAKERILLQGRVVYNPGTGKIAGDDGAVIVVLPKSGPLTPPLGIRDIRASDIPPPENHRTLRRIKELGGGYARANIDGNFSIVLPDQGTYCLLIISAKTNRPQDEEPGDLDLVQIGDYFDPAYNLIDTYKYHWEVKEFNRGSDRIEQDFGRDGESQPEAEKQPEGEQPKAEKQ